ncbi:cytochrome P450 [Micromonospora sp. NPDC000207]|uniref:cytochrome P450 n=1 Tax=Micromonospora sp. NPDC000207 TaxID=3154246 RepID=UPI00331E3609
MRSDMNELRAFPVPRSCPFSAPREYAAVGAEQVRLPTGRRAWVVTGYEAVRALLADRRLSADVRHTNFPALATGEQEVGARTRPFIRMDPPEHTSHRRMLLPEMTVRKARAMRRTVQRVVDERVDELLRHGPPVDLLTQFAHTVSSTVMCEMIGVRRSDPWFRRITGALGSQQIGGGGSDARTATEGLDALFDVFDGLVTERERDPGEDLLSRLIVEHLHTGAVRRDDLLATVAITVVAGRETTTSMIGLSVLALLDDDRRLWKQLDADPTLLPAAVEELLRALSVGDSIALRVATEDIRVGDVVIPAGDGVIPLLAGANHDPTVFADPSVLDFTRERRSHVAFGYGVHQCVGQNLARVELQVALGTLVDRIPTLRLDAETSALSFRHDAIAYGPDRVPVRW